MRLVSRVCAVVALALSLTLCLPTQARAQVVVHTVSITTDGSGNATVYTPTTFGTVLAIRYVVSAATPLATGTDLTITDSLTGLGILTATDINTQSREWWPRAMTVTSTGAAALYAAGGINVLDAIPVASPIKVAVAQGGATTIGTLYIYVLGR